MPIKLPHVDVKQTLSYRPTYHTSNPPIEEMEMAESPTARVIRLTFVESWNEFVDNRLKSGVRANVVKWLRLMYKLTA